MDASTLDRWLAAETSDLLPHFLIGWMSVNGGGEGRNVAGEPLRQEQVPAGPVDIGDGSVPERMEGVEPVEPRLHLPCPECKLDATLADADAGLGAEEGILRLQSFPPSRLVGPEFPEFTHQRVRQENIARAPTLGDFWPDFQANPGSSIIYIDISYVQPYNLGQP